MDDCKIAATPMEANFNVDIAEPIISNVPYRELIGCLTYLSVISRPDISFSTAYLGRYLDKPTQSTWQAAKRILKYLKGTAELSLTFTTPDNPCLNAYADADWAADKNDRKSVSGMAVFFGGNLVSWGSKKQPTVALSTAEAEYYAASLAATELMYIESLATEFNGSSCIASLFMDNKSALSMIENHENTKRCKHIDIKVHYIRDLIKKKLISPKYIATEDNVADILTKPLGKIKFKRFCDELNLKS